MCTCELPKADKHHFLLTTGLLIKWAIMKHVSFNYVHVLASYISGESEVMEQMREEGWSVL